MRGLGHRVWMTSPDVNYTENETPEPEHLLWPNSLNTQDEGSASGVSDVSNMFGVLLDLLPDGCAIDL